MSDESREPEVLCELRHVEKRFDQAGGQSLRVLQDVSLAIRANEVVALLGPSGCGKSTILRVLAALTPPTAGEVLYHGEPLRGLNPGIGFVFQSFALFPWMTVPSGWVWSKYWTQFRLKRSWKRPNE